jgi:opacity protein-like surface antigen
MAPTASIALALLSLSGTAFAGDLDDVATHAVADRADELVGPTLAEHHGGGGRGRGGGAHTAGRSHGGPPPAAHHGPPPAAAHRGPPPAAHHGPPPAARRGPPPGARPVHPGYAANRPGSGPGYYGARGHYAPGVRYAHVRPYHGVFVYGPRPAAHVYYVGAPGPVRVVESDLPERSVDRNNSFALGIKGGSMISGTDHVVYGDPGIGGLARFRPDETVGVQLDVSHHWGNIPTTQIRGQTQVAGSLALFAFPWAPVSPYVIGGATWNDRQLIEEQVDGDKHSTADVGYSQWGLHGGLGLEIALGKSVALDLEGRYIGWLERAKGDAPGALQTTGALLVHF